MKTKLLALTLAGFSFASVAQDKAAPPPPYIASGGHHYVVGVVWNEEALKLLPSGLKATPERTGAINIYQMPAGYGPMPYQSGYVWIDVQGHDSADGTKGRYIMKAGVGPEVTQVAFKRLFGGDIALGGTQLEEGRATGIRNGQPWVQIEVKPSTECQDAGGTLNYPISASQMIQIPYLAEACKAEPVSATITLPQGEKGAGLKPEKLIWAVELKNTRFALTNPVTMK